MNIIHIAVDWFANRACERRFAAEEAAHEASDKHPIGYQTAANQAVLRSNERSFVIKPVNVIVDAIRSSD